MMPGWVDWVPQVITNGVFIYFFRDLKTDFRDLSGKVYNLGTRVTRIEDLLEGKSANAEERQRLRPAVQVGNYATRNAREI